jgi:hypothetical protein
MEINAWNMKVDTRNTKYYSEVPTSKGFSGIGTRNTKYCPELPANKYNPTGQKVTRRVSSVFNNVIRLKGSPAAALYLLLARGFTVAAKKS